MRLFFVVVVAFIASAQGMFAKLYSSTHFHCWLFLPCLLDSRRCRCRSRGMNRYRTSPTRSPTEASRTSLSAMPRSGRRTARIPTLEWAELGSAARAAPDLLPMRVPKGGAMAVPMPAKPGHPPLHQSQALRVDRPPRIPLGASHHRPPTPCRTSLIATPRGATSTAAPVPGRTIPTSRSWRRSSRRS